MDVADEDEFDKSDGNRTNLSNPPTLTRSTGAGYFTFGGIKRSGGNTKKGVKAAKGSDYVIPAAKKAFNHLRHAFTQAPIFEHFDSEQHIWIKTNASDYAIGGVLNQLTLDDLNWWHLVTYYLQKMIPAKTQYKTHNGEVLLLLRVWKHGGIIWKVTSTKFLSLPIITNFAILWI